MTIARTIMLASSLALFAVAGAAHAQSKAAGEIEPVVPVGPPIVPTVSVPVGPPVQPVIPVESLKGVDTVTLDTPRGKVVVVSWPTSGGAAAALSPDNNVDFGGVDANRDSHVTLDELKASASESSAAGRLANRFDAIDANNDDKLDVNEVIAWVHR